MNRGSLGRDRLWDRDAAPALDEDLTRFCAFNDYCALPISSGTESTSESQRYSSTGLTPTPPPPPRQAYLIGPYSRPYTVMAPAVVVPNPTAPPPSFINVSQVYLFQQQLQNQMIATGTNPTREDNFRLQGVQWINDVRTALQL